MSKNSHGKAFERELLLSLKTIPNSFTDRQPGSAIYRKRSAIFIPPKIDLMFMSPGIILSIECKATKGDVFYLSQGMKPGQLDSLKAFSKIGRRFLGVLVIKFMRQRKIIILTKFNITKVTPNMKGYGKIKGVWQIGEFINEYKGLLNRKKVAKEL